MTRCVVAPLTFWSFGQKILVGQPVFFKPVHQAGATMFDYLFTLMGPFGSATALAAVLLTIGIVVGIGRAVGPRRLAGRF